MTLVGATLSHRDEPQQPLNSLETSVDGEGLSLGRMVLSWDATALLCCGAICNSRKRNLKTAAARYYILAQQSLTRIL